VKTAATLPIRRKQDDPEGPTEESTDEKNAASSRNQIGRKGKNFDRDSGALLTILAIPFKIPRKEERVVGPQPLRGTGLTER